MTDHKNTNLTISNDENSDTQGTTENWYEEKQARRKERYQELSIKAVLKSNEAYSKAVKMADVIPFGQPILLGHHSEKRDRKYRARITSTFEKSFEESNKAEYYERKAESVGMGGISSDDPEAIRKLTNKLEGLKDSHEKMKSANKIIKSKKANYSEKLLKIIEIGFKEELAKELLNGDFMGRLGFATCSLQNNNAEIKRIEKRIEALSKSQNKKDIIEEKDNFIFKVNYEINRIMFIFDGKPSEEVRNILKRNAFNWSKLNNAWIRKITPNALYVAKSLKEQLVKLF